MKGQDLHKEKTEESTSRSDINWGESKDGHMKTRKRDKRRLMYSEKNLDREGRVMQGKSTAQTMPSNKKVNSHYWENIEEVPTVEKVLDM